MFQEKYNSKYKLNVIYLLFVTHHLDVIYALVPENYIVNSPNAESVFRSETAIKHDFRPNIVLILADDLGWGDIGADSPHTSDTPNLDWLSKNGLRLTDFHAGASVCTPSRGSLMTGRLGLRTGIVQNFAADAVGGIPTNETTIAEVLAATGYRTAMLGKWHLGLQPGHHPVDKGFQSYLGVPYSLDMGCTDPAGKNLPPIGPCPSENIIPIKDKYDPLDSHNEALALPLYSNKSIKHQPVKLKQLSNFYAEFAEDFILSSKTPYFLYAALSHIHVPLDHGHMFDNITGKGMFADTIMEMDWLIGKILKAVKRHNDNTLIWFLSDNGPWEVKCNLAGSSGPFKGKWQRNLSEGGGGGSASKLTVWEGGHRVPSIIYWPGHIKAGGTSDALMSALDVLPTITKLTNASLPLNRQFDGMDVTNIITGISHQAHKVLFHPNSQGAGSNGRIGAVRLQRYKVVYYTGGVPECGGRTGPVKSHLSSPLVFDLVQDAAEAKPLKPSTKEWSSAVRSAQLALTWLRVNLRRDNTSTVNYHRQSGDKPCCDTRSPICRCPWD